ncbi:MAG TPA: hypothetical protein VKE93_02060 [Candidatus Angelobacter sp.]|nr:hypothetical protein [Candidatus Angelobacter sp.]
MKVPFNKDRADNLLNQIMKDPGSSQVDVLSNDLVKEFYRGYPLMNLWPLLHSPDAALVSAGVWIASELGALGQPLLEDVSPLLRHPEKDVRFDAINCLLVWATPSHAAELASIIKLMDDPERSVRWKAMDFLARASNDQLRAGLLDLQVDQPDSGHVRGLQWLFSQEALDAERVTTALQSQDAVLRKYAAVAARRISKSNRAPLLYAVSVRDPDVKNFAEAGLKLL